MNDYSHERSPRHNGEHAIPRWGALLGGSALAVYGISRRSATGAALAAAGGLLAFGGSRLAAPQPTDIHAEASFTVNVPPEEAFRFWMNLENLPRFMSHLQSVRWIDDRRSEWVARGPMQLRIKWTAEIVDRRENEWIVWRSEATAFPNSGSVQFRRAPGNRGTEVTVSLQYRTLAGAAGKAFAHLFGKNPSQAIYEDLRHFKQLIETGEIATTVGQPHGRRSRLIRLGHALYPDVRPRPVKSVGHESLEEVRVS
ncbi:MAG TPA: SRPBCC family protein [Terriglobales bacterium]|nr:SRPBCC family protein [Terriglobales bacterium]